jgi:hypothetical protein
MPTVRWKRSAEVALTGFGGIDGAAFRQTTSRLGRSQHATLLIGTQCWR